MSSGVAANSLILLNFMNSLIGTTEIANIKPITNQSIAFWTHLKLQPLTWIFGNAFLEETIFGQIGIAKVKFHLISNGIVELFLSFAVRVFTVRCFIVIATLLIVIVTFPIHVGRILRLFHNFGHVPHDTPVALTAFAAYLLGRDEWKWKSAPCAVWNGMSFNYNQTITWLNLFIFIEVMRRYLSSLHWHYVTAHEFDICPIPDIEHDQFCSFFPKLGNDLLELCECFRCEAFQTYILSWICCKSGFYLQNTPCRYRMSMETGRYVSVRVCSFRVFRVSVFHEIYSKMHTNFSGANQNRIEIDCWSQTIELKLSANGIRFSK